MSMKVYELAKELDIRPLDLVEKLKVKGMAVRNHMTGLSDEEVKQVMSWFAPKTSGPGNSPKVALRKKVVKKADASSEGSDSKKKSMVVRRKTGEEESGEDSQEEETLREEIVENETVESAPVVASEEEVIVDEVEETPAPVIAAEVEEEKSAVTEGPAVEEDIPAPVQEKTSAPQEDDKPRTGLRIVRRPKAEITSQKEQKIVAQQNMAASSGELPEGLSAKPTEKKPMSSGFGLRIVSRPEKVVPSQEEKEELRPLRLTAVAPVLNKAKAQEVDDLYFDVDDDRKGGVKRGPGGASPSSPLVLKGKTPVNRSQLLNEERADSELKSYAALGSLGRPLYTVVKKKKTFSGPMKETLRTEVKEAKRLVRMHQSITAIDLAKKLAIKFKDMVDRALDINLLLKPEDYLGVKLASTIAALYQFRVEDVSFKEEEVLGTSSEGKKKANTENAHLPIRNPIIAIMGHVDHGKTTLLDCIRKASVASGEAGGITQHIGAYTVHARDKELTFLDTPGHEAFASMRQRGAQVTDIVVLVVAADDGVMPQTKESIRFCKEAGVPIIVAVNKIDKEGVKPDRVKTELMEFGLTPEEWGGDTQYVHISALKGDGIEHLLDSLAVLAEVQELRADPTGPATGVVIESRLEPGRGPMATLLVQSGTLEKGDSIVVGECYGRARNLVDFAGKNLEKAGPSLPVQVLGLNEAPTPGDIFHIVKNEREAKKIVDNRILERKELANLPAKQKKMSLEDFFANASGGVDQGPKILNLIVRSDVQGTFEAIRYSLQALGNKEVEVKILDGGVGPITENDVRLAMSSKAFILGFNMRPITSARRLAEDQGVDIKTYSIIYELIDQVKLAMEGLLDPDVVEEFSGRAEVKDTFAIPKIGVIAGSFVIDGKILRGCQVRLLRDGKIVFTGKLSSLKRFKDDVKEVSTGFECGVGLENYNDVKVGDIFEAFFIREKKRKLEDVDKPTSASKA
jgi:translation initiation factor IF-2